MTAPKLRFKEFSEDYNVSTSQEASIQIIDGDRGNNYPKSDDFYDNEYCLFLNAGNVTKSGFKFENTQFINKEKDALLRKGKLQKNDLVITTRGTVGNIAYFDESIPFENIRINSGMVIARSEVDVEPIYLNQFLKSDLFEKWLEKNVFGSAQPQLTVKLLNSISISYPSKEEQTKIASFLSAVDEKISQLTQKHQLLSQYKQGMMQKLFSQQIRFKADDGSEFGEWQKMTLGDATTLISRRNKNDIDAEIYSVTNSQGFVKQNEYFEDRRVAGEDTSSYKIIKKNEFAYNPARINVGSIALFKDTEIGIISSLYVCFSVNESTKIEFLEYFLKLQSTIKNYGLYGEGGVRIYLWYPLFSKIPFSLPCLEEQTKIANFLSAIDQKIDVASEQLEQAKLWKKGLLQQMFV